MKKRILSLCMALALCLSLLPATALAAVPGGQVLYVGGEQISSTGYWTTDSEGNVIAYSGTGTPSDNYIHYDADDNILTLHNATIKEALAYGDFPPNSLISGAAIGVLNQSGNAELTIQLAGDNTIEDVSTGIYVYSSTTGEASLTVSGDGSLNASDSRNSGIWVQSNSGDATLSIQDAEVEATVSSVGGIGVLVQAGSGSSASLTVEGGNLTASGRKGILFPEGSPSLNVSESTIVRANGGIASGVNDDEAVSTSGTGIVFDNGTGTVYGNVTLQEDLTIGEGERLTLATGASLNANNHNVIVDGGTVDDSIKNSLGESLKYTPTITTANLSKGTVDTPYNQTLAADGTAPITWSVSDGSLPAGLSLNGNTVSGTPAAQGASTFTVTAANDYGSGSKEFTLTIDERTAVPVTGVKMNQNSMELIEDGTGSLTATVEPVNADNRAVTWESSNEDIATVDTNGKVTAHSAGTATITVKTADGSFTDTCSVTVNHGSLTYTRENAATCTEEGNEEYWTCDICGAHFSDADGNRTITLEQTVIPTIDHHYENGICTVCDAPELGFKPVITAGAGGTWQKGTRDGLSFTSSAAFTDFVKVQVDGIELEASDYEVKEGSTVVTLNASYLETLPVGKHNLAIVSDTGTAATEFTIQAAPAADGGTQAPETGDNSSIALWIAVMLAAGAALTGTVLYSRKKKYSR